MPTPASPDAVRIVLFGMPAAGKSSLLGALAQSAETQEHLLHGHLADQTHGLAELRTRLYDEQPRRTVEEIVPYPVAFEPFAPEGDGKKVEGILFDCDGRVANDLLMRRKSLDPASPEGTLARAVAEADGLILAIDASAPSAQIDADFGEFGRFLSVLEKGRGQRAEIGGFPVFLVLTKCDLLARPNESTLDWRNTSRISNVRSIPASRISCRARPRRKAPCRLDRSICISGRRRSSDRPSPILPPNRASRMESPNCFARL
jgi:hypothetical protein